MTTPPRLSRATFASTVGTALEWYDFSLYGTASALVFAHVFFPAGNELAGTLASLGTFAVGFFARPIGGVIIGLLGDRVGRRQMLFLTLLLMAAASTAIGLMPTYAAIGIWRSEEHTSELQSRGHLVCRLLLEKKKTPTKSTTCRSRHVRSPDMTW